MSKLIRLNLGSGIALASGFINVDKFRNYELMKNKAPMHEAAQVPEDAVFINADIIDLPFPDNYADYIECNDVIEHLPFRHVPQAFAEMYRVLKPGKKLCLMTTSFDNLAQIWLDYIAGKKYDQERYEEITQLIYGNQVGDGEFHLVPFNAHVLRHHLEAVGLTFTMTMYPMNTTKFPPAQTLSQPPDSVMRSDMIWVEATKPLTKA